MDSTTLAQQVYETLHARLRSGALQPGMRLVNRTLAAELGTSTIPVREAILRLASEGVLELTPGAGATVRAADPNELGELYDVREALETLSAAEAARYSNPNLIAELAAACERFEGLAAAIPAGGRADAAQFAQWLEAEEQFHARLTAASRNRWLAKVVREVRVVSRVFDAHRAAPAFLTRAVAEAAAADHRRLLPILASHDTEGARAWMTLHLRTGRETILKASKAPDSVAAARS